MIKKNKNVIIIIFIGFVLSVLLSIDNLNNHDKNLVNENGNTYHKMIKYDAYRYHSHGNGNTRYFASVVIYMSFFFGYGIDKIIDLKNKIKI